MTEFTYRRKQQLRAERFREVGRRNWNKYIEKLESEHAKEPQMTAENPTLQTLIDAQKQSSFKDPSTASDTEALGILIAHHFDWDGTDIMRAFQSALEDANYHPEAAIVSEWLTRGP